jgi:hypothetical protein
MNIDGQRLLDLLPALYRLRDAEVAAGQGLPGGTAGPLEALLTLVAEQLAIVSGNLDQLYDDQFIETCAPWVLPYIGDLIGYQAVNGVAPAVASPRAEVAHTISFRRRKGTVLVLEQLARDVTGWGAHAVEFFRLLAGTQYMNHIRASSGGTADLRQWQTGVWLDTAFDCVAHNADVRRIASGRGRHNIPNIGIFLWSLNPYSQTLSPAAPAAAGCYRVDPLGADMPLFTRPVVQGAQIAAPAQPVNVPGPLRRRVLCDDLQSGAPVYYGAGKSLAITINGALVPVSQIRVATLAGADGHWVNLPVAGSPYAVAVDPELGRIALPPVAAGAAAPSVQTSFEYGFNADLGSGEYPRAATFSAKPGQPVVRVPADHPTVHEALAALNGAGVVEISNSGVYSEPAGLTIAVAANGHIELRAADGARPTLVLGAAITVTGGALGSADLNGLVISCPPSAAAPAALVHVPAGAANELSQLGLTHCTLVPGWSLSTSGDPVSPTQPALVAETPGLALSIAKSICGPVRLHRSATAAVSDSFLDATALAGVAYAGLDGAAGGGALTLSACTVVGKVHAVLFSLISNSILLSGLAAGDTWLAAVWADRRQQGCLRFSYLPAATIAPQRFECVTQAAGSPEPHFYTLRYGQPEYGKLLASTDDAIRRGAEDGGEMGGFHFVLNPLREADLRVRLAEYLAVGMECGLIYAT